MNDKDAGSTAVTHINTEACMLQLGASCILQLARYNKHSLTLKHSSQNWVKSVKPLRYTIFSRKEAWCIGKATLRACTCMYLEKCAVMNAKILRRGCVSVDDTQCCEVSACAIKNTKTWSLIFLRVIWFSCVFYTYPLVHRNPNLLHPAPVSFWGLSS